MTLGNWAWLAGSPTPVITTERQRDMCVGTEDSYCAYGDSYDLCTGHLSSMYLSNLSVVIFLHTAADLLRTRHFNRFILGHLTSINPDSIHGRSQCSQPVVFQLIVHRHMVLMIVLSSMLPPIALYTCTSMYMGVAPTSLPTYSYEVRPHVRDD